MKLEAADYVDILEQRLREARVDLVEDPRLRREFLAHHHLPDQEIVICRLREKLRAAAQYGYEAIECSLRASCQDELLKQGRAVGEVRACLDEAARQMSVPAEPPYPAVADTGMKPSTWAGITFAVVVLLALLLYALVDPAPLIFVCLVGVGGIAAVMARDWRLGQLFRARERLLSEYPSQLCRHYVQALPEQIAAYESVASATQAPAEAAASAM